jgi:hypothetical protein
MSDKEQQQRVRAYKIWENEGRPEGLHDEHWKRAEDQHELTEQESEDVTKVNQQADDKFAREDQTTGSTSDLRPASTVSPD